MAKINIPRLDLNVKGVDGAVVRAAIERLPAQLTAALQQTGSLPQGEATTVPVSTQTDATMVASELARRIAALVHHRTPSCMRRLIRPGAAMIGKGA